VCLVWQDNRGKTIVSAAHLMIDTANSHLHRLKRHCGYNIFKK
jgi:hypothetical protein